MVPVGPDVGIPSRPAVSSIQSVPAFFGVPDLAALSVSLLFVAFLNGAIALWILWTRTHETATGVAVFLSGIVVWAGAQAVLFLVTGPALGFVLHALTQIGALALVTGIFHFALSYSGRSTRRIGLIYGLSGVLAVVVLTNPVHELLYVSRSYAGELIPVLESLHPPYWLMLAYYWTLPTVAVYLMGREYVTARGTEVYEKQAGLIVAALSLPLVTNVLRFTGVTGFNYSVWAFGATGVLVATALYRHKWLDLRPVGRDEVIERMREGYLVVDDDGRVVDLNEAARNLLDAENPVGHRVAEVFPECEPLLTGAEAERQITLDSAVVDATASPVRTRSGEGTLLMLRDVTERQRTRRRFQALIENVSDVITIVDEGGRATYYSPSVEEALGYSPAELTGENIMELAHPEDRPDAVEQFSELITGPDGTTRFEYRIRHRDGSWRTFEGSATDLLDDDAVGGVVIVSRDVTERKRRETQLERQNERLEKFASVVSHDLRNPLTVVSGQVHLLREEVDGHEAELERMADGLDRMEHIIEDVLTMATQGQSVEEAEPVGLDVVCRTAWQSVETDGATLTVETDRRVLADRTRLIQAFENFFRNANDHTEGDVTVRVGVVPADESENGDAGVTVYVEDDGPGIPPDEREAVLEHGHTTSEDGTGFGLSIVRDIVDAHDWTIEVTESESGGARFEIGDVDPVPEASTDR